jgi:ubiquinone/menaquinone biosynthesis C-methylase UbiE
MTFDEKAKNWDNDPQKIERANIFANEIRAFIKPDLQMNALEFGCGTGMQSYFLRNDFKTITLMDTSQGMLDVLEQRIKNENISNFKPVLFDLTNNDFPAESEKFDVIYTSMTMHHIFDINNIINKFNSMLNTGGFLCIADLEKEDGSFHSDQPDFNGHLGFDRKEIDNFFENNGYEIVFYKICFEIEKKSNTNILKKYPVFLIIGKKI